MAFTTTQAQTPCQRAAGAAAHPKPYDRAPSSATGQIRVALHRNACGVLLELEDRRSTWPRVVVVAAFTRASSFEDWCSNDPLRFEMPIVHQQIRREAEALWWRDS